MEMHCQIVGQLPQQKLIKKSCQWKACFKQPHCMSHITQWIGISTLEFREVGVLDTLKTFNLYINHPTTGN